MYSNSTVHPCLLKQKSKRQSSAQVDREGMQFRLQQKPATPPLRDDHIHCIVTRVFATDGSAGWGVILCAQVVNVVGYCSFSIATFGKAGC